MSPPGRVTRPPAALHQPAKRLGQVALGHDVVGQGVEDLIGIEVGDLLAAVPARVAGAPRERVGVVGAARRPAAVGRRVRSRRSGSRRSWRIRGHRW